MAAYNPSNPLIVQGDHTILVEVASPLYQEARDRLVVFAELVKSPEHIHTYRVTPLSIWNARAAGVDDSWILETLRTYSKYPVPDHIRHEVRGYAARFGRMRLFRDETGLVLEADDEYLAEEVLRHRRVAPLLQGRLDTLRFRVDSIDRGKIKQALIKIGYPLHDLAGYQAGEPLAIRLRAETLAGRPFRLRDYQQQAAEAFYAGGNPEGGSGVIVLPCGAGKTMVGLGCMSQAGCSTLILSTGITAARQWIAELLDKTFLHEELIGEYTGEVKQIRPITVATYHILTHRDRETSDLNHLALFDERNWGLIIYDEVHLLPAPVFQVTASLQARRRLGLTATLVREDGREDDVFALIGPKKTDIPWRELEHQGWIAAASCFEIRLPLPRSLRMDYAVSNARQQFRLASENPSKKEVVEQLLEQHSAEQVLIIGTFVEQLQILSEELGLPLITGATPQSRREELFQGFKTRRIQTLVVSKVANFSVDLPDASVAIQLSGTFGSRQEEAQRLGRILRPKENGNQARFFTIVTRDTVEQDFALKRQLFLCEQGYEYQILDLEPEGGSESVS